MRERAARGHGSEHRRHEGCVDPEGGFGLRVAVENPSDPSGGLSLFRRMGENIAQYISVPDMSVLLQETDRNEILTTVRH